MVSATSSRLAGCRRVIGTCGLRIITWMLMVCTRQGASEIVLNCNIGTIKAYELGVKHPANKQQHQLTAAAKLSFQQQLNAMQPIKLISNEEGSRSSSSSSSSSSSIASLLSYDKLEDQQRMFMHEVLYFLQRHSKAPTPPP
eukprot:scaffold35555_cov18-Tisochrysis_lutea.AAC.3